MSRNSSQTPPEQTMLYSNIVLIAILLSASIIWNTSSAGEDDNIETTSISIAESISNLVSIAPTNCGDAYLITNFVIILAAITS